MKFKFKFNKKLLILLCSFIFLAFSIISIRDTYARYVTSLTTKSHVELGRWLLTVNNHNIMENSDFSAAISPLLNTSTDYMLENKIVPGSSCYIDFNVDYTNVNMPFRYTLTYNPDATAYLEDLKFTTYTINGVTSEYIGNSLTSIIIPDGVTTLQNLKLNFIWLDGAGEASDDIADTKYAYDNDKIKLHFNISFTQLQPIEKAKIDITDPIWNDHKASVTIVNLSDYDTEYQILENASSVIQADNWTSVPNSTLEISNLSLGNVVVARTSDGALFGQQIRKEIKDTTKPTVTIENLPEVWTNENITLVVIASDNESDLHAQPYSFDGGSTWQTSNSKTYSGTASAIVIKVRDKAGNITTQTIDIIKIDNTPPSVTIAKTPPTYTDQNVTLTISASDNQSNLHDLPYSFDGGATWQASNTRTYTENTSGIVIKVRDKLENTSTHTIDIDNIDRTPPSITISGNPTDWTNEDVTLTINASDSQSDLHATPYSFDGGSTWQASNRKTYTENTSGIVIKVRDTLGNTSTQTVNITYIDNDPPSVTISGNPTTWTDQDVTLTINASDSQSNLHATPYSFDGGATWQTSNAKTYTENTSGIVIKVRDRLGNTYTQTVDITKIDKSSP